VKDICRAAREQYSSEDKFRIVLNGLRGEHWNASFAGAREAPQLE